MDCEIDGDADCDDDGVTDCDGDWESEGVTDCEVDGVADCNADCDGWGDNASWLGQGDSRGAMGIAVTNGGGSGVKRSGGAEAATWRTASPSVTGAPAEISSKTKRSVATTCIVAATTRPRSPRRKVSGRVSNRQAVRSLVHLPL